VERLLVMAIVPRDVHGIPLTGHGVLPTRTTLETG
jgi:hypothetical protein